MPASLGYPLSVFNKNSTLKRQKEMSFWRLFDWDSCALQRHDLTYKHPTNTLQTPSKTNCKHTDTHTATPRNNTMNALQHTATHCNEHNALQHTATHCNAQQHTVTRCNALQHTATHCNILQHTATYATYCNALQGTATHCNALQHTATYCNTLQLTATHCNALQYGLFIVLCTGVSFVKFPESPLGAKCTMQKGFESLQHCNTVCVAVCVAVYDACCHVCWGIIAVCNCLLFVTCSMHQKNTIHHTHCECSVTILRRVGVVQFVKVLITTHCNIHIPAMFHSVLQCVQCVVYITLHKFVKKVGLLKWLISIRVRLLLKVSGMPISKNIVFYVHDAGSPKGVSWCAWWSCWPQEGLSSCPCWAVASGGSPKGVSRGAGGSCLGSARTARQAYAVFNALFVVELLSLQHTATHCTTLHHTAPHCTTLHHTATHCNTLQRTATRSIASLAHF